MQIDLFQNFDAVLPFAGVIALLLFSNAVGFFRRRGRGYRRARPAPTRRRNTPTLVVLGAGSEFSGKARVVDGDTIVVQKISIRLYGIDAPEMDHPHGERAKWALVDMCKGQTIRAVVTDVDAYGRTVAKCYLPDGRDLSAEMVKCGLAIDWAKFSGGVYRPLERQGVRKMLWLADARQKGQMHVWRRFEAQQAAQRLGDQRGCPQRSDDSAGAAVRPR